MDFYVMQCMRWSIGYGTKIIFWHQCRVSEELIIANHITKQIRDELSNKCVSNFVDVEEKWNWSIIDQVLPNQILLQIAAIKHPSNGDNEDLRFLGSFQIG